MRREVRENMYESESDVEKTYYDFVGFEYGA
jgi:hypothetical protein